MDIVSIEGNDGKIYDYSLDDEPRTQPTDTTDLHPGDDPNIVGFEQPDGSVVYFSLD